VVGLTVAEIISFLVLSVDSTEVVIAIHVIVLHVIVIVLVGC